VVAPVAAQTADTPDCANMDELPQQEMNYCAGEAFRLADAELNAVWAEVRDKLRSDEAEYDGYEGWFDTALKGQRGWIAYRDGQCEAEAFAFNGGSMQPLIDASCKERLTRARIDELTDMLAEN
jgi:uncharacterized protein YecT (DUF1311 family)